MRENQVGLLINNFYSFKLYVTRHYKKNDMADSRSSKFKAQLFFCLCCKAQFATFQLCPFKEIYNYVFILFLNMVYYQRDHCIHLSTGQGGLFLGLLTVILTYLTDLLKSLHVRRKGGQQIIENKQVVDVIFSYMRKCLNGR